MQIVKNVFKGHVIAITSSESKVPVLKQYGADEVLVCDTKEKLSQFHKMIHGGVDIALECVGIPTMNSSIRSLRPNGRYEGQTRPSSACCVHCVCVCVWRP